MNMISVSSSNVAAIGYDDSNNQLYVRYNDGGLYVYSGVPHSIYQGLLSASSKGTYLHRYVKGTYSYRRA
jgi:hypothetical protein